MVRSDKGVSLNGLGNYTQAIQYYNKALAIDPNDKVYLDITAAYRCNLCHNFQILEEAL